MYNKGRDKVEYMVVLKRSIHLKRRKVRNEQEDKLIVGRKSDC